MEQRITPNNLRPLLEAITNCSAEIMRPLIMTLGGPSASGKSTLGRKFKKLYPLSTIISTDDYYIGKTRMLAELPEDIAHNFDHPSALNLELLKEHMQLLRQEKTIQRPNYDMLTSEPLPTTTPIDGGETDIIVIEGIAANLPIFEELVDISTAAYRDDDKRVARRLQRDIMRKGYEPAVSLEYITQVADPAYEAHYRRWDAQAEFTIDNS